jgi:acetyl esterase/lipase
MLAMNRRLLTTAAATAGAFNTVNALRPLGWGKIPRALASFAFGLPTSELPLQLLGAQAVAAVGLRGSGTRVSRGLTAASWAGLVALELQARQAPAILDGVLSETLGQDYRSRVRHPRERPRRDAGLVRTSLAHRHYTSGSRDISYGPAGHRNQLDFWRRPDLPRDAGAPVLVQIHGGGWMAGDRTVQAYPLMTLMAELGWVCASISYRLSPRATWPAQLDDVKAAIAWVKENVAEHGGDPDFVAVTGGSAGGHLTMLSALELSRDVRAAVPYYGPPDWTNRARYRYDLLGPALARWVTKRSIEEAPEVFRDASPIDRVHRDAPPFLILQGSHDNLVSAADGRAFAEALRAVSTSPVGYAELPGAWHAFDLFSSTRARATAHAVADFLGVLWAEREVAPPQVTTALTPANPA